jgi:1-acyl-sn-glycerol-3-phosphate acyltransferase
MGQLGYSIGNFFSRWIYALSIHSKVVRREIPERPGGYLLACSHISHLEPFIISALLRRKVDWMARIEFYRLPVFSWFLYRFDAFPVNRFGVPVSAIRTAINRAKAGRAIGIFPEGGVAAGKDSACRGGPLKRGMCLIAMRARVPIIPCVLLGTHELTKIEPWLPFRRAKLWIAFGEPIQPPELSTHKAGRRKMAEELSGAFCSLYRELLDRYGLTDEMTP